MLLPRIMYKPSFFEDLGQVKVRILDGALMLSLAVPTVSEGNENRILRGLNSIWRDFREQAR